MMSVIVRGASGAEAARVHEFIYGTQHRFLRSRSLGEVETLIGERAMFIVEDGNTQALVSACYIDNSAPDAVEYGGAFTAPSYRGRGLGRALGTVALVHHYLWNQPSPPVHAHVHTENSGADSPRRMMEAMGFVLREVGGRYDPAAVPGIAHMPTGPDGMIEADLFRLSDGAPELVRYAIALNGRGETKSGVELWLGLPEYQEEPNLLEKFLAAIEA